MVEDNGMISRLNSSVGRRGLIAGAAGIVAAARQCQCLGQPGGRRQWPVRGDRRQPSPDSEPIPIAVPDLNGAGRRIGPAWGMTLLA